MKKINTINENLREVLNALVSGNFKKINSLVKTRLKCQDIENVINDYPGKLVFPPISYFSKYHIIEIERENFYRIEFDLWYDNEQSDLTIILEYEFDDEKLKNVELVDIRVM